MLLSLAAAPYSAWASAAFFGLAPVHLLLRRERLLRVLRPRVFVYLPALAALATVVWSLSPAFAFLHAVELALVATAGMLLASAPRPDLVVRALAVAFPAALAGAVTLGGGLGAAEGVSGLAIGGLVACAAALHDAWRRRERAPLAGLALAALYQGAVLATMAPIASLACGLAAAASVPLLGLLAGAAARWRATGLAGVAIALLALGWRAEAAGDYLQLILTAGWIPLIALLATISVGGALLARRYVCWPSPAVAFWIAMLLVEAPRLPIAGLGMAPLSPAALLLFAALTASFGRAQRARPAPRREAVIISLDEARVRWAHARLAPSRIPFRVLDDPETGR
jgi:hypothetical protein